jgi:flavin reductase (DIM6/NTAB) family NADH-FMN oxidoreductase RutF
MEMNAMEPIDPSTLTNRERYRLMTSAIIPRPIALVTSIGRNGVINAAPFSYFNGVTSSPPILSVSVGYRKGKAKDTGRNIRETGEFVVNIVSKSMAEKMNRTSGDFPPDVSEIIEADLATITSEIVAPPRLAESPVQMECKLYKLIEIGEGPNDLILGEVLRVHLNPDVRIDERYHIDPASVDAIGRLGGLQYCTTRDVFEMVRPKVGG